VWDLSLVDCVWQQLFRIELPASEYQPANPHACEVFTRTTEEIGRETFDLRVWLPPVRL
jgi:hypothetical protein